MLAISLFAPGLFDFEIDASDAGATGLDALELLLARGRHSPVAAGSYCTTLCRLFSYEPAVDEDIPMAAIGRLIDDEKRPEGYWMRADPVHLHAGQKSLTLLDSSSFSLTQHDALALAACVRQSFTELGWELEVPVPSRWYVKIDRKPSIRTTEIQEVMGRDISEYMPTGADAGVWTRLMNEIQMQLHDADINQLRRQRGELPVNSLWLWGTGKLPQLQRRHWSRIYSDDTTAMGLSMLSNTPCLPLTDTADELFARGNDHASVLVFLSEFQTAMLQREQRRQQLERFEQNWCRHLLQQLQRGKLHSLRIITRSRQFDINKISLMKFWKRTRKFNTYVS